MNKLKENLKDVFTDLIGAVLILLSIYLFLFEDLELGRASVPFLIGVAFFFIPDDILSQIATKVIKKKVGDEEPKP